MVCEWWGAGEMRERKKKVKIRENEKEKEKERDSKWKIGKELNENSNLIFVIDKSDGDVMCCWKEKKWFWQVVIIK